MLWPLFGIANQMLATIALCVATAIMVQTGRGQYLWITALPALSLVVITTCAALEKLFSGDIRIGYLAAAQVSEKLAHNQYTVAVLTVIFLAIVWVTFINTILVILKKREIHAVSN